MCNEDSVLSTSIRILSFWRVSAYPIPGTKRVDPCLARLPPVDFKLVHAIPKSLLLEAVKVLVVHGVGSLFVLDWQPLAFVIHSISINQARHGLGESPGETITYRAASAGAARAAAARAGGSTSTARHDDGF